MQVIGLGQRGARASAPSPTACVAAASREALLRDQRRAVAAPAPGRRHARHRQARRPVAHEADRAARQHLARRAGRGRRAGRRRSTAAAPAWPRSTCSRASRSCRATRCCGWRTRSARRTSATSSRTATSCTSAPRSTTSSTSSSGSPTNIVNPEALQGACAGERGSAAGDGRRTARERATRRRAHGRAGRCCSATSSIGCGVMVVARHDERHRRFAAGLGRGRRPADRRSAPS